MTPKTRKRRRAEKLAFRLVVGRCRDGATIRMRSTIKALDNIGGRLVVHLESGRTWTFPRRFGRELTRALAYWSFRPGRRFFYFPVDYDAIRSVWTEPYLPNEEPEVRF